MDVFEEEPRQPAAVEPPSRTPRLVGSGTASLDRFRSAAADKCAACLLSHTRAATPLRMAATPFELCPAVAWAPTRADCHGRYQTSALAGAYAGRTGGGGQGARPLGRSQARLRRRRRQGMPPPMPSAARGLWKVGGGSRIMARAASARVGDTERNKDQAGRERKAGGVGWWWRRGGSVGGWGVRWGGY